MEPTAPTPESLDLLRSQHRLIRLQRAMVFLLLLSLIGAMLYAHTEKRRADQWQSAFVGLSDSVATPVSPTSAHYPAVLIADDGTRTPLSGKGLEIDLGGERLLDIDLQRVTHDRLFLWAPGKRDDTHFNRLVLHPCCANAMRLELERFSRKSSPEETVTDRGAF